ncbi:MAG: hypothetical protein WCT19_04565 [Candidatus Paceibacterota bacterium]|jgi:hexosaminidase
MRHLKNSQKQVEYMTFPRIAAMSEVLWSRKEVKNRDDFYRRLGSFTKRYDEMDINYARDAFANRFNNVETE